jgi:hypothetical protein
LCAAIETDLEAPISPVVDLTDFATVYRYPGAEVLVGPEDAREWRDLACRLRAAVLDKLPPEIREAV